MSSEEKIELKRKFINVTEKETNIVKELLSAYGMKYMNAPEESDELCCKLVNIGKVYACLSEDTDLFVYGCPLVLSYLSLKNHTVVLYNYNKVLCELNLSDTKFRELCVISGTDYNREENMNIINNYELVNGQ